MRMHSRYEYHQLSAADVPQLKVLLHVFGEAFEESDTYQGAPPSEAYLARLLGKEHFIAIVATADNEVIGGLTAYVLDKFEQERREIYVYDLAVVESHRRCGIATGLIEKLRVVAAALRAYVIFVQADLQDSPAISLYEKFGTKETAHHFDIDVPGQSDGKKFRIDCRIPRPSIVLGPKTKQTSGSTSEESCDVR